MKEDYEEDMSIKFRIELSTKKGSKLIHDYSNSGTASKISPIARRKVFKMNNSKENSCFEFNLPEKDDSPLKRWLSQSKQIFE